MIKDVFNWLTFGKPDNQYIKAIYSPHCNARSVAAKRGWSNTKDRQKIKQDAMTFKLRNGT